MSVRRGTFVVLAAFALMIGAVLLSASVYPYVRRVHDSRFGLCLIFVRSKSSHF
jgi:hypothetical protein